MILIVSSKRDNHITIVAAHLKELAKPFVRLNTDNFITNCVISIDPAAGSGSLSFHDSSRNLDISAVRAVWFRKPEPLNLSHFDLDQAGREYVEAECNEVLQGLWALLGDATWINNPLSTRPAHRKLLQLQVAKSVGLSTPRTLVTNDMNQAITFFEEVDWDVAVKSLGAITVATTDEDGSVLHYGIFTRRVNQDELQLLANTIPNMPSVFQEYITKDYELRVTVVGKQIFSCRIFSQDNDNTKEDCRFDIRTVRHEWCRAPEIEANILAYMEAFGLNFGCFDFAVTETGEHIFFECNPNGQWLWIEEMTGAPISRAIAELLTNCSQ